jgi:ribonucleoside-diphosphate reductase alpha chain
MGFLQKQSEKFGLKLPEKEIETIGNHIYNLDVVPSMRLLMTAGEAVERDNICAYNCAYLAINNKRAFSEALYILMNGTGVGFSCERQEIGRLPSIPEELKEVEDTIVVGDSKLGWAKAYKKLLSSLWDGDIPRIDYSGVRPAGARLRTFGGRASGPDPLRRLFNYVVETFKSAAGRKLTSLEVHDILCMTGEVVVVGGVRRSALISLSNLTDRRMREAKTGAWWEENPQRALANNSVVYTEKPDVEAFMEEWISLVKSKSGERGIFNRLAAAQQATKWGRRDSTKSYGCNPCSEIILRDKQFCNLSEVVVRPSDTFESLRNKVRIASIIGTIQSTLTDFNFLSEEWKKNCEEERLLGVSLTGIMDHPVLSGCGGLCSNLELQLLALRDEARKTNEEWAERLGITASAAITCVKPSGTVSELVGTASGIHPRYSEYYIRAIRQDNKDPLTVFLKENGVKWEPAFGKEDQTTVFYFPVQSPAGSVQRTGISAIEQLEHWLIYQRHWCEHKPSITVYVRSDEWLEVGSWVYKYFDEMSGVSFLPYSDHTYVQAPFTECTKEEYEQLVGANPKELDWSKFEEKSDHTTASQELACIGGACYV